MKGFHYHEPLKSRIKVFFKKYRRILYYNKICFLNRCDPNKVNRIKSHIQDIKKSSAKQQYQQVFKDIPLPKVAIYTCIFGNYDSIKKIKCKSKFCDYLIITDRKVSPKSGWKVLKVDFPEDLRDASATVKNRYCKMHPHILFPNYDFSIYLDGSRQIDADIFPLIGRLQNRVIGMYDHGSRDCIYDEAEIVIRVNKAPKVIVEKQMQKYREEGFPRHFGLTEGGVIVRKHNDPLCVKIMEEWWYIFLKYSKRDQLGLMYVMWKNGLKKDDIAVLGANYEDEVRLTSEGHKGGK